MAARSTRVILINRTRSDVALVKTGDHLDHGIWSDKPPDFVGNKAEWGSESSGILTGTEGWVTYQLDPNNFNTHGALPVLNLRLEWDNPYFGSNSYGASVNLPGQSDGSGFSVGHFGGGGDNAEVTFVLLSGKCVVDSDSGEIACSSHTPLVQKSQSQRYAAIWEQRGGSSWEARHGLNSAQYQQAFDQLLGEGYRLVVVSGYSINGEERYAAIWEQRSGSPWQARHGLNSAQYQQAFDQLLGQGYRLTHVSGYSINGEDHYAAIWEQRSGSPWQARHGLKSAQYQQAFDQLLNEGYRLVHVSGYNINGEDRYAAIWEQRDGPAWQARHGLNSAQYQQAFDQLFGDGYRLVRVSGYSINGEERYAAIWEQRDG